MDFETLFPPGENSLPFGGIIDSPPEFYVGHIVQVNGSIQTNKVDHPAFLWGEVLLTGRLNGPTFILEQLHRVALYGNLDDPEKNEEIGVFSLAGPLEKPIASADGSLFFRQQLHYAALSTQLEPLVKSYDAVFPQMEQIAASLRWTQASQPIEGNIELIISILANDVVDKQLGLVQAIQVEQIPVVFQPIRHEPPPQLPRHHSLTTNCPPPPACPAPKQHLMRLPLKFINLSTKLGKRPANCTDSTLSDPPNDIEAICQSQIDMICAVWRQKASLELDVQPNLEEASCQEKIDYSDFNPPDLSKIRTLTYQSLNYVEIYLVNNILDQTGGGISYDNNNANTICFLEVEAARANPYLLAHELGHMLGLDHPEVERGLLASSTESIMQPAPNPPFNPPFNTLYNCRVFDHNIGRLNPIVSTTNVKECFHPDPIRHLIRDFPQDDGLEPSNPPVGENFWSNSNVWNRHKDRPGALLPSSGPRHEQPLVSSDPNHPIRNFLHVKLERLTAFVQPVTVEFYISDPGVSSSPLRPIGENYKLLFAAKPRVRTQSLPWIVPPGYRSGSSIFAISYSMDAPSPIEAPTSENYGSVASFVPKYSSIAQRNMNIHELTLMNPRSIETTLAWVQMDNPFDKEVSAKVEVDASQAVLLDRLVLEMDNNTIQEITPGESTIIQVSDYLRPGERKILRMRATIPSGLPEGSEHPIYLRFFIDDQLISGYTHILRVVPFATTRVQVLDMLFSAIRDVEVGYNAVLSQNLADKVKQMTTKEIQQSESSRFTRLLLKLFRSSNTWKSELRSLAGDVAALGQILETKNESGILSICQHLSELSRLMSESPDMHDITFIESIRDRADRIQEPAGRLARKQSPNRMSITNS